MGVIYYFSATGNSLCVARDLANELGGAQLVPVTHYLRQPLMLQADSVGAVFPVYMFGLPLIIADFLRALKTAPGAYVYTVATYGGLQGMAHSMASRILAGKGIALAAGFSVVMPGNYTPLYGAIPLHRQKNMFDQEKTRVNEIAASVRKNVRGIVEEKPFLPNFLLNALLYKGGSAQIVSSAKNFRLESTCTHCGLCARVCPVRNIRMSGGVPQWEAHCQHCMACLQWCPVKAIQYKKTAGRERYHHPDIQAEDIAAQQC
jgi:ferredoxin